VGGGVGGGGVGAGGVCFKRNCEVKVIRRKYRRAATADINTPNRSVKECLSST